MRITTKSQETVNVFYHKYFKCDLQQDHEHQQDQQSQEGQVDPVTQ